MQSNNWKLFVPSYREVPDFVETRERVVRLEKEA